MKMFCLKTFCWFRGPNIVDSGVSLGVGILSASFIGIFLLYKFFFSCIKKQFQHLFSTGINFLISFIFVITNLFSWFCRNIRSIQFNPSILLKKLKTLKYHFDYLFVSPKIYLKEISKPDWFSNPALIRR